MICNLSEEAEIALLMNLSWCIDVFLLSLRSNWFGLLLFCSTVSEIFNWTIWILIFGFIIFDRGIIRHYELLLVGLWLLFFILWSSSNLAFAFCAQRLSLTRPCSLWTAALSPILSLQLPHLRNEPILFLLFLHLLLLLFFLEVYISLMLLDEHSRQPFTQYLINHCYYASLHLSNKGIEAPLDLVWTLHWVHLGFESVDLLWIAHAVNKNLKQAAIVDEAVLLYDVR